ncbi:MAG: hypothetical protein WBP64_06170 [Nitrososphaeraceae archaeon]
MYYIPPNPSNTWITNTSVLKEEEPVDDLAGGYRKETVKKVDT